MSEPRQEMAALARALKRIAQQPRQSSLDVPILEDAADALTASDAREQNIVRQFGELQEALIQERAKVGSLARERDYYKQWAEALSAAALSPKDKP